MIAEGALAVPFEDDERPQVRAEVAPVGAEAQRRLSSAREVMASLHPDAALAPEPVIEVLARELEGMGVGTQVATVDGEVPTALVPGAGWSPGPRQGSPYRGASGSWASSRTPEPSRLRRAARRRPGRVRHVCACS